MLQKSLFFVFLGLSIAFSSKAQSWPELGDVSATPYNNAWDMCTDPDGNVYTISSDYSVPRNYIAKWDGTHWTEIVDADNLIPDNAQLLCICSDALGNIYVGGFFPFIAKWNGVSWSKVGENFNTYDSPNVLLVDAAGNLYAAGDFKDADAKGCVMKWDGTSWSVLGTGTHALQANNTIQTMCADPSGNLYAAGDFTDENDKIRVAKWNGSSWALLPFDGGVEFASQIESLCSDKEGNIYSNHAYISGRSVVAKWDGTSWSALGITNDPQLVFTDKAGNIYASVSNFTSLQYLVKWDGHVWNDLGRAQANYIGKFCSDTEGNMYLSGSFHNSNGEYRVAKFSSIQTAIQDDLSSAKLSVYPNPASSEISFDAEESGLLKAYDLSGQLIFTQETNIGTTRISLEGFQSGVYLFVFTGTASSYKPVKVVKH